MTTKNAQRKIKGCLEVRATKDTPMGKSTSVVQKGMIGYVVGSSPNEPDHWLVFWPDLKGRMPGSNLHYNDSFRVGAMNRADLEMTGRRG